MVKSSILIVFLCLLLVGCLEENEDGPCYKDLKNCQLIEGNWQINHFSEKCERLAKCMDADWHVASFKNQSHNPFACSITTKKKDSKGRSRNRYIYPKAGLSFGNASWNGFDNEIAVCEMMTHTGDFSVEETDRMEEFFKVLDERKRLRQEQEKKKRDPKIKVIQ